MRTWPRPACVAVLLILSIGLSGCTAIGPKSISAGRRAYAEAINQTEDEQLLLSIVKGRYGETSSLLAVNGIAASLRFRAEVGAEIGVGPDVRAGENLLLGGFAFEENPTITYAPVQGESYVRELMSPVPLELLMLVLRAETFPDQVLSLLVSRANGLRNPDFLRSDAEAAAPTFARFVELFAELRTAGVLDLSANPRGDVACDLLIEDFRPGHVREVDEFLSLLDLPLPADDVPTLLIPVSFAINTDHTWSLGLVTRSTFDLIEIMRASILVPAEHEAAGICVDYPPRGLAGRGIEIASSQDKPDDMSLAVPYRGYWFYIRESDQNTKAFFRTLRTLWSINMAGTIDQADIPVLTIPVGQ